MSKSVYPTLNKSVFAPNDMGGVSVRRVPEHHATHRHDHLFHELVYIESGSADHDTAGGLCKIRAGDLIVIRPQVWHAYLNPSRFCLINCLVDGRLIRRFADLLGNVPSSFDLYFRREPRPASESPVFLHCPARERSTLLKRLKGIIAEQQNQSLGWQLAAVTGALDVMLIASRLWARQAKPRPSAQTPTRAEQAVFDAVIHLESTYTQPVDLDALAEMVHLSRWHFSRIFTQRMGMGVVEFAHQLRVEEACRRLRLTGDPITHIAMDLGYNDISYFTRCFKKRLGQSPRAYRAASGMATT